MVFFILVVLTIMMGIYEEIKLSYDKKHPSDALKRYNANREEAKRIQAELDAKIAETKRIQDEHWEKFKSDMDSNRNRGTEERTGTTEK